MKGWLQVRDCRLAVIVLLNVLVVVPSAPAQKTPPPTLDKILLRLENNLHYYDTEVPDLSCSEHVVSSMGDDRNRQTTVTDSLFRLRRTLIPGQATTLVESREVKAINGTPAKGQTLNGPTILTGVFSGGLDAVSLNQQACMRYTLQPVKPGHFGEPYVVQFTTLPNIQRSSGCVLKEEGSGQVFIDPTTMQVTRMELTAAHHVILPGVVGVWGISIDYAPVLLGGHTFWMPEVIASTMTSGYADDRTVWSFHADYTNYHKFEVTSRIVP